MVPQSVFINFIFLFVSLFYMIYMIINDWIELFLLLTPSSSYPPTFLQPPPPPPPPPPLPPDYIPNVRDYF